MASMSVGGSDDESWPPSSPLRSSQLQKSENDDDASSSSSSSASEVSSSTNSPLLNSMTEGDSSDVEGISLLRQIFPDESTEELRRLHRQHIQSPPPSNNNEFFSRANKSHPRSNKTPASPLGQRIWDQKHPWTPKEPPDDFLRLPSSIAVRRYDERDKKMHYRLIKELEHKAWRQDLNYISSIEKTELFGDYRYYTVVIEPDSEFGLGLTLIEEEGMIKVLGLTTNREGTQVIGPSYEAGIKPGDIILGLDGEAFAKILNSPLLQNAVRRIHECESPIVIHLISPESSSPKGSCPKSLKTPPAYKNIEIKRTTSLLDSTVTGVDGLAITSNGSSSSILTPPPSQGKKPIHPFAKVLRAKGLIRNQEGKSHVVFTDSDMTCLASILL